MAEQLAARLGARLRAGLGPLAVSTDDIVLAPTDGSMPARSSREDLMVAVKKEVKKGVSSMYLDGIRNSQREMKAPSIAVASVQTASLLTSECDRCPFLLQHAMKRGLAMTKLAHQGEEQAAGGADVVLLDVEDFARGAASAGVMDEIMLSQLPRGAEDEDGAPSGAASGSKAYYSGGALSPAVLPIIIIADDHSMGNARTNSI